MSWFSPLTDDQKATLEWAKEQKDANPQGDVVTAVPVNESDILKRVTVLEAKSKDKSKLDSDARVSLKNRILEETKKSRLQLREALEKKMGEMSAANAAASMKLTAEVGMLQKDVATTNGSLLKLKDKVEKGLKLKFDI